MDKKVGDQITLRLRTIFGSVEVTFRIIALVGSELLLLGQNRVLLMRHNAAENYWTITEPVDLFSLKIMDEPAYEVTEEDKP